MAKTCKRNRTFSAFHFCDQLGTAQLLARLAELRAQREARPFPKYLAAHEAIRAALAREIRRCAHQDSPPRPSAPYVYWRWQGRDVTGRRVCRIIGRKDQVSAREARQRCRQLQAETFKAEPTAGGR